MASQTSIQVAPDELYTVRSRECLSSQECMTIYDKWAATYDAEVTDEVHAYVAPDLVAQVSARLSPDLANESILDAGCGTGLVGIALTSLGAKIIDGIDLSVAMLDMARKAGVYRDLNQADLNSKIDITSNTYDMVTCVGTFTLGHVGPAPALRELIRVTRPRGTVIATILQSIWLDMGFKAEVENMEAEKLVTVVSDKSVDYVKKLGDKAILLIVQKTA